MESEATPKYGTMPDRFHNGPAPTWYEFGLANDADCVYTMQAPSDKVAIATMLLLSSHHFWAIHRPRMALLIPAHNITGSDSAFTALFGDFKKFAEENMVNIVFAIATAQIGSLEERDALNETLISLFGLGVNQNAAEYIKKWCDKRAPKGRIDYIKPLLTEAKNIFLNP